MNGEPTRDLMAELKASIVAARRHLFWTVEVRADAPGDIGWTKWTEWVDRATAEAEKQHAIDEGYRARIVRAS